MRLILRDMIADLAPEQGALFSREAAIAWFEQRYPKIKRSTISAHLIEFSTNAPSRVHYNARPDEDLLFQVDRTHFRLYDSACDPLPIRAKSGTDSAAEEVRMT